jgi:hypothetical protein
MIIILLLMLLTPLFAMILFTWLMKRFTGYDPRGQWDKPLFKRNDIDFLKLPDFYSEELEKKRKSKKTPHYDALVDAEWQASRLEDSALPDDDSDRLLAMRNLVEEKKQR